MRLVRYDAASFGIGQLWLDGGRLVHHELPRPGTKPGRRDHPLARRFEAYFRGERATFADVELDLDGATPFQAAIAAALRSVRYGETVTYGELAALAGHPNAQRAAGTFCARNRFPIVLPCHRVIGSTGIGAYGSLGLDYKRRLLELEGVAL